MKQRSFSQAEYSSKKRRTRRDRFLSEIDRVTPWAELMADIEPYYPKQNGPGRPPRGLETMLHMYIAQQCFGLSDEGIEDAIYDSMAIRNFVGVDLSIEEAPDATTLLKFGVNSNSSSVKTMKSMSKLNLGQRVCFDTDEETITGILIKLNQKTVIIATDDGMQWKVSPQLVKPVLEDQPSNVTQIRQNKP